jgi:hypothetical protein
MKMDAGKNSLRIACTLEVINIINSHCSLLDMYNWTWLIKHFLESSDIKTEFIQRYGIEKYNESLVHYSRTSIQIRTENAIKKAIEDKKEEQKMEIEKLKAEAYKLQVTTTENKAQKENDKEIKAKIAVLERQKLNLEEDGTRVKDGKLIYANSNIEKEHKKFCSQIEALKSQLTP